MTAWPVFVFGAPGAIIGLALCVAGLLRFRPVFLVAGALVLTPSAIYLGGFLGIWPLLTLPLLPLLAALALRHRHQLIAGLVLVPNATTVLWLAMTTISNLMAS